MTNFSDLPDELLVSISGYLLNCPDSIYPGPELRAIHSLIVLNRRCHRMFKHLAWRRVMLRPHMSRDFIKTVTTILQQRKAADQIHECVIQVIIDPQSVDASGIGLSLIEDADAEIQNAVQAALGIEWLRDMLPPELELQGRPATKLAFLAAAAILHMRNLRRLFLGGDYLDVGGALCCLIERRSSPIQLGNGKLTIYQDDGLFTRRKTYQSCSLLENVGYLHLHDYQTVFDCVEAETPHTGPDPAFDDQGDFRPWRHKFDVIIDARSRRIAMTVTHCRQGDGERWLRRVIPEARCVSVNFDGFR